jgi:hypothetical protein
VPGHRYSVCTGGARTIVGEVIGEHRQEMAALVRWARIDDFDRAALNRAPARLPTGPAEGTS